MNTERTLSDTKTASWDGLNLIIRDKVHLATADNFMVFNPAEQIALVEFLEDLAKHFMQR
jgi:hypothetical protein